MSKSKFELTAVPEAPRAKVVIDPLEVQARLRSLSPDISRELLFAVAQSGLEARNDTAPPASAVTAASIQQWLKTVEALRLLLGEKQWLIHNEKNCPFISSPDRSVSIVVMTANAETGKQGFEDPTNQAEKGIVTEGIVRSNRQLELFNSGSMKLVRDNQKETQVWVFFYHYDKIANEVRFELSYPTGFSRKKITELGERIIVGSIPNNPQDFTVISDEPNAPPAVDVVPKTGTF